jgi:hypothetical protein
MLANVGPDPFGSSKLREVCRQVEVSDQMRNPVKVSFYRIPPFSHRSLTQDADSEG